MTVSEKIIKGLEVWQTHQEKLKKEAYDLKFSYDEGVIYFDPDLPLIIFGQYGELNHWHAWSIQDRIFTVVIKGQANENLVPPHFLLNKIEGVAQVLRRSIPPDNKVSFTILQSIPYLRDYPEIINSLPRLKLDYLNYRMLKTAAMVYKNIQKQGMAVRGEPCYLLSKESGTLLLSPTCLWPQWEAGALSPKMAFIKELQNCCFNGFDLADKDKAKTFSEEINPHYLKPLFEWAINNSDQEPNFDEPILLLEDLEQRFIQEQLIRPFPEKLCQDLLVASKKISLPTDYQAVGDGVPIPGYPKFSVKALPDRGAQQGRLLIRSLNILGEGSSKNVYKGILVEGLNVHSVAISTFKDLKRKPATLENKIHKEVMIASEKGGLPNLIAIWDTLTGFHNEIPCFEQIQVLYSGDLEKGLKKKLFPLNELLKLAKDVATGLKYYQQGGRIHGDLKPANIFFSKRPGEIAEGVLADIGGGSRIGNKDLATSTPLYSSPERLVAIYTKWTSVGQEHDVWSFGAFLLELLYGLTLETPTLNDWADELEKYTANFDLKRVAVLGLKLETWKKEVVQLLSILPNDSLVPLIQKTLSLQSEYRPKAEDLAGYFT